MNLKEKIKVVIFGPRACNESFIKHLRDKGVIVGDNVVIFRPLNTNIDIQNPHLLSIGNDVMITGPATILTHDFSWSVLKKKYGDILGKQQKTIIGNNVFIGWGATILAGSVVGNNTIIGANSVVSGVLKPDAVYAGNPAKYIMSINEFYEKRKQRQLDEAVQYVLEYKKRFNLYPPIEEMDEYFLLFTSVEEIDKVENFNSKCKLMNNYDQTIDVIKKQRLMFKSYQDFLSYCEGHENEDKKN